MRITNVRLRTESGFHDIDTRDGVITAITPAQAPPGDGVATSAGGEAPSFEDGVLDAGGALACEPFVEPHLHLDYANTVGQPRFNQSGTLFEAIEIWTEHKALGYVNHDTVMENALAAVRSEVAHGVGFIRSHVDVTDPELVALDTLLELREKVAGWCEIQIIAFPQSGITTYPRGAELMEEAMRRGADVVGGIPHFEWSREAGVDSLRTVFDLAERYDKPIDVHCDEIDDDQSRFLEVMAEFTVACGMQGRVTAAHAVAAGYYGAGYLAKLIPKLVAADMCFAVNPTENLHLQGWGQAAPMPRGVAPIREFTEAGLNVSFGQDSIADPWYPIGEGALLRILDSALHVGHMLTEEFMRRCLDFISVNGAVNLGVTDRYGIEVDKPANLILLDATDDKDALWHQADVLASIRDGRVVFTRPRRSIDWKV